MKHNIVETIIGAVVLLVAAGFVAFAYNSSGVRAVSGYELIARFERVDGVAVGSDIRIGGIKVGSISRMELDPKTYLAVVHLSIEPSVKLPADTVASISSTGLLGDKFLALVPGGDEKMLPPGGVIQYTQASVSIENLIGQFMFSQGGADKKGEAPADAPKL
ncbi:phospholipid/cholesterol/gamma-HCH transport system substrate-binding protein [Stella humosa]|uniref:Phospholipid/cholesterol/gamma-HCH transport system substrate-binding protein n=1 Tax=Stella humosa TaxID=94 RepID=A0A3N1MFP5_9PROT|nr:outer membrane lipid asymmetry maintenance protein MlaD [Stella humosa]ROQ00016.1 phospholipid/cholesterol/gamma-HCH transport system substrate-binding protein [Stella humosa]BBK30752.1 outer membrane lipid asymmetry maintenance protein MlaD [Stella humosa]